MDDPSTNQYEQQLYLMFKSFDVNNEDSLDESAVTELCDALQLEERGAVLVDTLFERREGRVSFEQFRSGLLAVLGESAPAPPEPPEPPHDRGAAARELAPRFVLGAKQYGRRSRPHHAVDERAPPRAASASRLEGDERRPRFRRSASAMERRDPEPALQHDRRVDRDGALALCRSLRMHSIDRRLVDRVFEDCAAPETTVGEFFDRLNASLASAAGEPDPAADEDVEADVPAERLADAWESAGVRRPRRLLVELGFAGAAVRPADLERALDDELRAYTEPPEPRAELLAAALAAARLRVADAARRRDLAAAERDKLRAAVAEANERARLLAQEVDENHARIETDLKTSLRRAETRAAEEARRAALEAAAERERARGDNAALEAEVGRLRDAEARLRAEAESQRRRADEAEARAAAGEERGAIAERAAVRAGARLRELEAAEERAVAAERSGAAAAERLAELQREHARLRDRSDELAAALEARVARAAAPDPGGGALAAELAEELPLERAASEPAEGAARDPAELETRDPAEIETRDPAELETRDPAELETRDPAELETRDLAGTVRELERALDAMRAEYEACEEYWGGKLAAERAAHDAEARAADDRLADLVARIAAFERRLAPPPPALPTIAEAAALELQVHDLEAEFARYRRTARARTAALAERLARAERRAAPPAPAPPVPPTPAPAELWARCARAEGGVRRLQARLAAAELLVKELFVENCHLAHARPLPP